MEVVYSATESGAFAHDLHTGALLSQFDDSGAPFVLNGPYMCSISKALLYVHAWGQKTPCYRASLPEKMTAVQMAPAVIFSGGLSGKIYAWHASSGHLLHSWTAHYKAVTSLAVENNWLVSGSEDGQVLLWNLADLQKSVQSWSHALPVTDVKITPGQQPVVVSSSLDHTVREWDVTGPCIRSHMLPAKVLGLAVSLGQIIACGDGLLTQLGDQRQDWQVPCGAITSVSLNTDGCVLATSSNSVDRVRIWDSRTRQALRGLKYPVDRLILNVSIAHRTHALPFPMMRPLQRVIDTLPDTIALAVSRARGSSAVGSPSMNDWSDILQAEDTLFSDDLLTKVDALQDEVTGWRSAAHELWDHMQNGT